MSLRRLLLVLSVVGLVGCESLSDAASGVRERIAVREAPKTKTFPTDPRATYDAVRTATAQMGYKFQRGGPAQGEFEAVSSVGSGDRIGTARQLAMKVRLEKSLAGGTDVSVRITEILEADSSNRAGQATETPLRDTPQYEVFFEHLSLVLGVPAQSSRVR